MNKKKIKIHLIPIIFVAILVALDQLSKHIITGTMELYESKTVIDGVFSITYIQNRGMAWGMLQGQRVIFIIITILLLLGCFYLYNNISGKDKFFIFRIVLVLLMAGAIGNFIDRFMYGYVVDFFNFELINFPIFNVADIFVVISMFVGVILLLFKYNDEEFNEILGIKSKE